MNFCRQCVRKQYQNSFSIALQEADAAPAFFDTILHPFYSLLSYFGITKNDEKKQQSWDSQQVNGKAEPISLQQIDDSEGAPAEVAEIQIPKRPISMQTNQNRPVVNDIDGEEAFVQEIPIVVINKGDRMLINMSDVGGKTNSPDGKLGTFLSDLAKNPPGPVSSLPESILPRPTVIAGGQVVGAGGGGLPSTGSTVPVWRPDSGGNSVTTRGPPYVQYRPSFPTYARPQIQYERPQNQYERPQNQYARPQNQYPQPSGTKIHHSDENSSN